MFINFKTDFSIDEIDNILSDKVCHKHPPFGGEYDLGINWVKNSSSFICLFYENGAKDRWGGQTTVKSFFYGRIIRINGKNRIIGISCVNIFFIIVSFIILTEIILNTANSDFDSVFGIIFFCVVFVLFLLDIPKGNKIIKDYLKRQFSNE